MAQQIILALLLLSIVIPFGAYFISKKRNYKRTLAINISTFFVVLLVGTIFVFTHDVNAAAEASDSGWKTWAFISAALSVGISSTAAGFAVSTSASAAIGALSENDTLMGKCLIFVALAEGVALYGLLVAFMILNKV